jgi:predicted enzyme related to lactoylglutathione lyase
VEDGSKPLDLEDRTFLFAQSVRAFVKRCLEMEDFDAAIAELKKANVTFVAEAFETPVCHMAVVQDPDGNKLMIHKLKTS